MRYLIKLSYIGAGFCGWQIQDNAPSVQEELQKALGILLGTSAEVTGAGRTDTKVNAINYIAHFDTPGPLPVKAAEFAYKLSAITPKNIAIHEVSQVDENFHARFSATSREYRYFIHRNEDPFMGNFSWHCRYQLDMDKMNEAAAGLLGTHDFSCFEKTGGNNATSVCTVMEAGWEYYEPSHVKLMGYPAGKDSYMMFTIRADRFLRNMVRAIVGTLVDIGRGKLPPEYIPGLIESRDRSAAGESAPGNALFLSEVKYGSFRERTVPLSGITIQPGPDDLF